MSRVCFAACLILALCGVPLHAAPPSDVQPIEPTPFGGTITGVVLGTVANDGSRTVIVGRPGLALRLANGLGGTIATTTSDSSGAFALSMLDGGSYVLHASDTEGNSASVPIDVLPGVTVRRNFVSDARRGNALDPSYAAILVGHGEPNPDVNGNDVVDLEDLQIVEGNVGAPADDATGDLDSNGVIDNQDVQIVRAAFGRSILRTPGMYSAMVSTGGSTGSLGGLVAVTSTVGHTSGTLSHTPTPGVARFTVSEDQGTATASVLGDFAFFENPDDPSYLDFQLDTGLVVGGRMTLRVEGGVFEGPYYVEAVMPDGVVTLAPGGFSRYRVPNVEGTLEALPVLGTVALAMDKGDDKKADKACETKRMPRGSAICDKGGTACKTSGAACAKNGNCGTCHDVTVTRYSPSNPNLPIGTWCKGCSCF